MAVPAPVLYLIVCGAPPAQREPGVPEFVLDCKSGGWDVCVIPTRYGRRFIDTGRLAKLTGHPLREDYKHPSEEDVLPAPDALVVAPATFNTVNKLAVGIADTLPLGLLNEAVGAGMPVILAPWTNEMMVAHPAFGQSVKALRAAGVRFVPDTDDPYAVASKPVGNPFPWADLIAEVERVRQQLAGSGHDSEQPA